MLALLIAVATALTFTTTTPMTPPASGEGESFCLVPETHDTPFISKQESGERTAPRGDTNSFTGPRIGDLAFIELQALVADPIHELTSPRFARSPGGIYPRGPPARA